MKKFIISSFIAAAMLFITPVAQATQLELMGLAGHSAKAGAPVGMIDTLFNPSPFPNTQVVGPTSAGYSDHGTWMNAALSDPTWGTAANTQVIAHSCQGGGGIELICAQNALQSLVDANHVRVISLSFSYAGAVPQDIINQWATITAKANSQGILVLASSGNSAQSGFPANVPGVLSVGIVNDSNQPLGAADVHLRAPQSGIITHPSCSCDAVVSGVSYSTAWAAGLASRLLAEGNSYQAVRSILTQNPGQSTKHPTGNIAAIAEQNTIAKPSIAKPVAKPVKLLSKGSATYRKGRLAIKWSSKKRVFYKVQVGKRKFTARRTQISFKTRIAPQFVYVRTSNQTLKIRVILR